MTCCRLGDWIYAQNLLYDKSGRPELGKLKLQHRGSNKVSTEEDAAWRFAIPSNAPKDCIRDLYNTQLQHFRTLLRAVESHPGFQHAVAPGDKVGPSEFLQLTPSPKVTPHTGMHWGSIDMVKPKCISHTLDKQHPPEQVTK